MLEMILIMPLKVSRDRKQRILSMYTAVCSLCHQILVFDIACFVSVNNKLLYFYCLCLTARFCMFCGGRPQAGHCLDLSVDCHSQLTYPTKYQS